MGGVGGGQLGRGPVAPRALTWAADLKILVGSS